MASIKSPAPAPGNFGSSPINVSSKRQKTYLLSVPTEQQKTLLFASAAILRVLLAAAFPTLPDLLTGRVEISTPITSFKRLQEGLFLYNHGLSPYDGGVFHQAPLLLPLFSLLPDPSQYPLVTITLYTAVDLLAADALITIVDSGLAHTSPSYTSPRRTLSWSSTSVAATYLFNPFTLLTCLGRPTSVFANLFTLLAIAKACDGKAVLSAFALALAAYMTIHPILLFPPLVYLTHHALQRRHATCIADDDRASAKQPTSASTSSVALLPSMATFAARQTATMVISTCLLLALSYLVVGSSWQFVPAVYSTHITLSDLTPTVGLWWYYFIEIFDSFRSFFLAVFWLHMAAYSPAITIRLKSQPLAATVLLVGVHAIFAPYADVGGAGMWLAFVCVFGHLSELSRYPFPALATLLTVTFLGPAFYYLWIYAGSGNANFFYAITLVWALALSVLLGDLLYAVLRDEWEVARPEMKGRGDVARI